MKNLDRFKFRIWDIEHEIMFNKENFNEVTGKKVASKYSREEVKKQKYQHNYYNCELLGKAYHFNEYWIPNIGGVFLLEDFIKEYPDKFILMQCTGLKDKNGKLIYEGDIVQLNFLNKNEYILKYEVKFVESNRQFILINKKEIDQFQFEGVSNWNPVIIGNIYENKDLINDENGNNRKI